jgi:hypothetical protein
MTLISRTDPLEYRLRAQSRTNPETGCREWLAGKSGNGYGRVRVCGVRTQAHRAAYELFVGPIPAGLYVCHRCDNRACINPDHLFLGTQKDNVRDMDAKGRGRRPRLTGERQWAAKLNATSAAAIARDTRPGKVIAQEYGVSRSTVCRIKRGELWRAP